MMHRFVACLVCLLVIAPRLAAALDLGPIEARSALYEPLDARIGIDGIQSGDLDGLKVALGSPAQFELAGVARLQHLDLLEFTLVEQDDGGGYIRVWTDEPIIEPSLTFLIDVDWPRGRAVRGYKLHLSAAVGTAGASSSRRTAGQAEPESESGASAAPSASPPAGATYGPVRSSDTLWSIAARFRPDKSISVQRMMLAILEANPQAFAIRNVNALNAGAILRIPTLDEIGSDDASAAIAEAKSQHSAWKEYREGGRPAAAPATPESRPAPTGRVEVVSPETTPRVAGLTEDADASALRNRLALAIEEADTGRRQNNELKLRLVEAEDQIRKLSRLVDLKNDEVAALQAELRATAEAKPAPAPSAMEPMPTPAPSAMEPMPTPAPSAMEPMPTPAPSAMEPMPTPAPSAMEPMPTPAPSAMEPMPTPAPSAMEPMPTPAPSEMEPMPTPAPSEMEPMPTPAPSETIPDEAEPETTPFGLGALPINPVFLVGGAGLLLILLGVVALLRRRRASSDEEDVAESMGMADSDDSPPAGDDDLLQELEAVAADLADDTDAPQRRNAQTALAVDSLDDAGPGAAESAILRFEPDSPADEQTAELWPEDTETERALLGMVDADDDADLSFDIDAPTGDDSGSSRQAGETSDEFDIDALEELAALAPERDADADAPSDEAVDDFAAPTLEPGADANALFDEAIDELAEFDDLAALTRELDAGASTPLDEAADDLDALSDLAALMPESDTDAVFDELADELGDLDNLAALSPEGDADAAIDDLSGGLDDLRDLAALSPEGDADTAFDELADELGDLDDLAALSPEGDADAAIDDLSGELHDLGDLAALSPERDADPDRLFDETADDSDDVSDFAGLAPERDTGTNESFDGTDDDLDALFGDQDARTPGSDAPASAPTSGAGGPSVPQAGPLEGEAWEAAPASPADGGDSSDSGIGTARLAAFDTDDWSSTSAAPASIGRDQDSDDAGESDLEPELLFDETTGDGDTGAFSLDDIGEDEMQTKIDLAQVYMEMGDTDSARGFLEAVLAEGDTDQQEIAREMISRLT